MVGLTCKIHCSLRRMDPYSEPGQSGNQGSCPDTNNKGAKSLIPAKKKIKNTLSATWELKPAFLRESRISKIWKEAKKRLLPVLRLCTWRGADGQGSQTRQALSWASPVATCVSFLISLEIKIVIK